MGTVVFNFSCANEAASEQMNESGSVWQLLPGDIAWSTMPLWIYHRLNAKYSADGSATKLH